ncbi:16S rRNA (cytosine(967)-C(5))-methyltransferase RsmB [Thalassotalea euphylliae]|uniref:16S rRNA (cytosine(967)-C(5))-methyltransferase RsmB n=1 Tax=Thalassotalea euphylliae TaxID=1655234 RepID=UPI00362EC2E5
MSKNIRAVAARICFSVVDQGKSLSELIPQASSEVAAKDKGLLQEICYGVLRHLPELEYQVQQLMDKPLKGKQRVCHFLLLVGIYQVKYTRIPDHAAVSETVSATLALKHKYLKALVNGVLRSYLRNKDVSTHSPSDAITYNHPSWLIKKLKAGYADTWQDILTANMERPPMWLRANALQVSVEAYQQELLNTEVAVSDIEEKSGAIQLSHAVDVTKLPGFEQGRASVQDAAAQQSARLLDCQPGDVVLDCCAAPGGKTCHLLEHTPEIKRLTALDIEENRLARVQENLDRIGLQAKLVAADATNTDAWWDGELFDRILLDAPCSATGVIRRHPDIKWLRKPEDIDVLASLQRSIFEKMWSLLKPGGTLVYATCSVLPQENAEQVQAFIEQHQDAELIALPEYNTQAGWQILPGEQNMDGFFYAKLKKRQ